MMASKLQEWIDTQRENDAKEISVRPARSDKDVATLPIDECDETTIEDACRASLRERKMSAGSFRLKATGDSYRRECTHRVDSAGESDKDEPAEEMSLGAICRAQAAMIKDMSGSFVSMSKNTIDALERIMDKFSDRIVQQDSKAADVLNSAYEMASLKREIIKDEQNAQQTRDTISTLARELGPVAGAVVAHWAGKAAPAMQGLIGSLTPEQQRALMDLLDPAQRAALSAIIEAMASGNAAPKPNSTNGAPTNA